MINLTTTRKTTTETGFTLLEVLVVLVLVALVSTTILQGFTFAINVQTRIKKQLTETQNSALQENWFRETVRSFQPNFSNNKEGVIGTASEVKGISLTPLYGQTGIPTATLWRLKSSGATSSLYYKIDKLPEIRVATWNSRDVTFKYTDAKGEFHSSWPPDDETTGLPKGILISTPPKAQGFAWYAAISNSQTIDFNSFLNQGW